MDKLESYWSSLGITFERGKDRDISPEEAIIETIKSDEFPKDRKMFSLMYLWLIKNNHYVHIERLKNFSKKLDIYHLSLLGAMSAKISLVNHKWKVLVKFVEKKMGNEKVVFSNVKDSDYFIRRHGIDEDFKRFGINLATLKPADEKKILSEKKIIKLNKWIKNRCLFGINLRADMATVIELKLAKTAYQASKVLHCTVKASYDNWSALIKVGWPYQ